MTPTTDADADTETDPLFTFQIESADATAVLSDQPTSEQVRESGRWIAADGLWEVRP